MAPNALDRMSGVYRIRLVSEVAGLGEQLGSNEKEGLPAKFQAVRRESPVEFDSGL